MATSRLIRPLLLGTLTRPRLLFLLLLVGWRFRRREWYRHWPFLPLPSGKYIEWRMHTAFGDDTNPPTAKLAEGYLRWAHKMGKR
jgi:hypothetical protein